MDLEDKVSNIVQFVESGDCNQADLKKALLSIQGNVGELGDYFSREFARNPEFYNERRADDFGKSRAFNTNLRQPRAQLTFM